MATETKIIEKNGQQYMVTLEVNRVDDIQDYINESMNDLKVFMQQSNYIIANESAKTEAYIQRIDESTFFMEADEGAKEKKASKIKALWNRLITAIKNFGGKIKRIILDTIHKIKDKITNKFNDVKMNNRTIEISDDMVLIDLVKYDSVVSKNMDKICMTAIKAYKNASNYDQVLDSINDKFDKAFNIDPEKFAIKAKKISFKELNKQINITKDCAGKVEKTYNDCATKLGKIANEISMGGADDTNAGKIFKYVNENLNEINQTYHKVVGNQLRVYNALYAFGFKQQDED